MLGKIVILMFSIVNFLLEGSQLKTIEFEGIIARYDFMNNANADFILKSEDDGYIRLIYCPYIGFDAPPLKPEEMLPTQMFSENDLLWCFKIHEPQDEQEIALCKSDYIKIGNNDNLIPVDRYTSVPGRESDIPPEIGSLPCFFVDSWDLIQIIKKGS